MLKKSAPFFALLLAVSFFSSCKIIQPLEDTQITNNIDGLSVPPTTDLSSSELTIAKRICSNIKTKREFFETLYNLTEKFKFNLVLKSCDGVSAYYNAEFIAAISNTSSTFLEYSVNLENYFKDIVTDQSGSMKLLCDVVGTNNTKISNTHTSNTVQLIFKLLVKNGYDRVEISKRVKNSQGKINLSGIETIDFITQASQASAKFIGVEKERVRKINCDGKNFSSMTQTWLSATTSF